jgi:hypothetical protein
MMKGLILLALVAYAAAQGMSEKYLGQIGYETKVEVDKNSGIGKVQIQFSDKDYPAAGSSLELYLRVLPASDALSAGGAKVDFFVTDTEPTAATLPAKEYKQKAANEKFFNFDYKCGKNYTTRKEVWVTVRSTECKSCSSTLEVKVGLWLIHADGATDPKPEAVTQDFLLRDNSYTADYTLTKSVWGASGIVTIKDVNLFLAVDGPTSGKTIVVISKAKPKSTDDPTKMQESATWKPIPGVEGGRGNYRSGGRFLENGDWFVTPFVNELDLGSTATFDFAVGLGHEPSSSSIAVPSLVSLALIALALFKAL